MCIFSDQDEDHLEADDENMVEENGAAGGHVDDSFLTFDRHTSKFVKLLYEWKKLTFLLILGDVFTVDVGANGVVATGGEDDRAFVWNFHTAEILFECKSKKSSEFFHIQNFHLISF